jgi:hypothetical protein
MACPSCHRLCHRAGSRFPLYSSVSPPSWPTCGVPLQSLTHGTVNLASFHNVFSKLLTINQSANKYKVLYFLQPPGWFLLANVMERAIGKNCHSNNQLSLHKTHLCFMLKYYFSKKQQMSYKELNDRVPSNINLKCRTFVAGMEFTWCTHKDYLPSKFDDYHLVIESESELETTYGDPY